MDGAGSATAILSVSTSGVHLGDDGDARAQARAANQCCAALVRERPDRFGFCAGLPLPDVEGALAEAAYALDVLQADGVVLLANLRGSYLGDAAFDPLFDELNRRTAVVVIHPAPSPGPAVADPTQILSGSDWRFAPPETVAYFNRLCDAYPLDEEIRTALDRGNAERLVPRLARRLRPRVVGQPALFARAT